MDLLLHSTGSCLHARPKGDCTEGSDRTIWLDDLVYEWIYTTHYDLALNELGKVVGFSIALDRNSAQINITEFLEQTQGVESGTSVLWVFKDDGVTNMEEVQGFCEVYQSRVTGRYAFLIRSLDLWQSYELDFSMLP
jgi:hypothetical protein